jgi:hypothetical protein
MPLEQIIYGITIAVSLGIGLGVLYHRFAIAPNQSEKYQLFSRRIENFLWTAAIGFGAGLLVSIHLI